MEKDATAERHAMPRGYARRLVESKGASRPASLTRRRSASTRSWERAGEGTWLQFSTRAALERRRAEALGDDPFGFGLPFANRTALVMHQLAPRVFGGSVSAAMPSAFLSELMEAVVRRGDSWSSEQDISAGRAAVTSAWAESEDPFSMLLLLAAIHPYHNEPLCDALVASMSFFPPMQLEREKQAQSRPGMNYNGPDRFRFLHVAQRLRASLREMKAPDRSEVEPKLSAAIRTVVNAPFALAPTE